MEEVNDYLTEIVIVVTNIYKFFYAYAEYCVDNHMT